MGQGVHAAGRENLTELECCVQEAWLLVERDREELSK